MTIGLRIGLIASAAAAAGGCMAAPEQPRAQSALADDRQCFLASRVNRFDAIDDDTVLVTVGVRETYRLELTGTCPQIDWSQQIGFRSTGSSSWVCSGYDAELLVPHSSGSIDRCPVVGIRRISPEEAQAIRASSRD